MKKANLILSCIGVLSVIGGALAFKAQHRFSGNLFCYTTASKVPVPTSVAKYTITTKTNAPTLFCTAPAGDDLSYRPIRVTLNS